MLDIAIPVVGEKIIDHVKDLGQSRTVLKIVQSCSSPGHPNLGAIVTLKIILFLQSLDEFFPADLFADPI